MAHSQLIQLKKINQRNKEKGMVIFLSLFLLTVLVLIGSNLSDETLISEKFTQNYIGKMIAKENTETVLRSGEHQLDQLNCRPFPLISKTDDTKDLCQSDLRVWPIGLTTDMGVSPSDQLDPEGIWAVQLEKWWQLWANSVYHSLTPSPPSHDHSPSASLPASNLIGYYLVEEKGLIRDSLALGAGYTEDEAGVVLYRLTSRGISENARSTSQSTYGKRYNR
jgi:hypothetical protein